MITILAVQLGLSLIGWLLTIWLCIQAFHEYRLPELTRPQHEIARERLVFSLAFVAIVTLLGVANAVHMIVVTDNRLAWSASIGWWFANGLALRVVVVYVALDRIMTRRRLRVLLQERH